jgi:hypothetical protein
MNIPINEAPQLFWSEAVVEFPRRTGACMLIKLYDCLMQFVHVTLLELKDFTTPFVPNDVRVERVTGPWTLSMFLRVCVTQNVPLLLLLRVGKWNQ